MTPKKSVGRVKPRGDGEASRDATHTDDGVKRALVNAPPAPEKRMAFRLWFAFVILLEYKIVKKQLAMQPHSSDGDFLENALWSRFTLRTQWLNIMIHATTDICTLFYLNALHPRWGVRPPSDGNGAAELTVPTSVPLLARHVLKLAHRVPPLNACVLGAKWWCHHGYTLSQALIMSLAPSCFAIAFNNFSVVGLALMGLYNSFFIALVSISNRYAYVCSPDVRAHFLQGIGGEYIQSRFLVTGVPIAFVAPFVFDVIQRRASGFRVQRRASGFRASARVFFGVAPRSVSGFAPLPAKTFARRLRSTATIVVHAVAFSVAAANVANGAPLLLVAAAAFAQTTAPLEVATRLCASSRWRDAHRANGDGTALAAARWTVSSVFAFTATATTVATKMWSTGADFDATSSSRAWSAAVATVAAATHACAPGIDAFTAIVWAAMDAAVFVAGRAIIDPAGGFDAFAATLAFVGSFLCAMHLNDALTFARRAAARRPDGAVAERPGGTSKPAERRVAASGGRDAKDNWRLEDFVVDPLRFEVRAAKDVSFEDRRRFKPMAYDASTKDSPRVVDKSTCRATNCRREVDERNLMAAGVALCVEHLTSKELFEYGPLNRAALFCLMCRRVHVAPLCRESMLFSGDKIANAMTGSPMTPHARGENGKKDAILIHASLKTEEDPVTAVNRARGVFDDVAAENPEVRHAVMSARPGCTIVSVDLVSDDSGGDGDRDARVPSESNRLDSSSEDWTDAVERFLSSFARNGYRRQVRGTLYFRAVYPRTGAMRTRRIIFRAKDEGELHIRPEHEDSTSAYLDAHPMLRRAIKKLHDPRTEMLVVRSDCFDAVRLPTPPPGFHYNLRLDGTYLPLSMHDDEWEHTATSSDARDEVDILLPPTRSEGLGFIELVKSIDVTGSDELSEAAEVIFTVPVFMTPDSALAHELSRDRDSGGACMEHVPVLVDLGASLRRGGVVSSDIELFDHSRNQPGSTRASIQQISFQAACACASQGWLIALTRVLEVHASDALTDADDLGNSAPRQMSTDPDTATDESTRSGDSRGLGTFNPTLRTKLGLWTLLRSVCSSGDATIVKVVAVMAIRYRGAVEVAELMCACDPAFISPLHATALAIATKVREGVKRSGMLRNLVGGVAGGVMTMSHPVKSAIEAAIIALTMASDPLAWTSGTASSAQESPMAFASRPVSVRGAGSSRATREISAANTRVIDVLAGAVVHAMRAMHDSRFAPLVASLATSDGSVDATHANAAATLIALKYDGTSRATIAAALLSPGSSHYHGVFRRRDADESRGEVGLDEARAWLLAGASPHGFPPASATESRSRRLGLAAVAAAVAMDATVALVAGNGAGALAAAVMAALVAKAAASSKTTRRRLYLCHHLRANAVARLAAFVVAVAVSSAESAWSMAVTFRVAGCVAQAWAAPAGNTADAVIVGANAMVAGAPWWVAAIAAGTSAAAAAADERRARRASERLVKAA